MREKTSADDTAEFVRLLSRHERRVKSYILALLPNWADADEIYQETNVRLWEQFASYDRAQDFGAWACTIAYYMVLAFRKRSARAAPQYSPEFFETLASAALATTDEADRRYHALADCLRQLDPASRDLVRRCYAGDRSLKDIAAQSGRSSAGLYKTLSRLRHSLHVCIEGKLRREEAS